MEPHAQFATAASYACRGVREYGAVVRCTQGGGAMAMVSPGSGVPGSGVPGPEPWSLSPGP